MSELKKYSGSRGFTSIQNVLAKSWDISVDTGWILVRLLSLHPDKPISLEKFWAGYRNAKQRNPDLRYPGRDRQRTIMKELEELGYVLRVAIPGEAGKFMGTRYIVFDTPEQKEVYLKNRGPKNCSLGEKDTAEGLKNRGSKNPNLGETVACISDKNKYTILPSDKNNDDDDKEKNENSSSSSSFEIQENEEGIFKGEELTHLDIHETEIPPPLTHEYGSKKLEEARRMGQNPITNPIGYKHIPREEKVQQGANTGGINNNPYYNKDTGKTEKPIEVQKRLAERVFYAMGSKEERELYFEKWGIHPSWYRGNQPISKYFTIWAGKYLEWKSQRPAGQSGMWRFNVPEHLKHVGDETLVSKFDSVYLANAYKFHPELLKVRPNETKKYNPVVGTI